MPGSNQERAGGQRDEFRADGSGRPAKRASQVAMPDNVLLAQVIDSGSCDGCRDIAGMLQS